MHLIFIYKNTYYIKHIILIIQEDPRGLHRLGCKAAADAGLRRHDALADVVAKAALAADHGAFKVARKVGLSDAHTRARPGDVALDLGSGRTLLDVTVVNPFLRRVQRRHVSPV